MFEPISSPVRRAILHIEDNDESRILVRRVLQIEGFEVWDANDSLQALDIIEKRVPDLILMDINLPGMDGYTLTSHLKNLPQLVDVPIVAITANVMKGDREKSLDAGCDEYIQKPIDVDTLGKQLSMILASREENDHG